MQRNNLIIVIIAVLVLGGGAYALTQKPAKNNTPAATTTPATSTNNDTTASPTPAANPNDQVAAVTITYKDGAFSPTTVTIKSGESVNVINGSNGSLDFKSDPHPTHTDNTELNAGEIAAGSSMKITVTKAGTWGYHNHLNPTETGSIVVQ